MGDGDLMVSPVETDIEMKMGESHVFDANTVQAPKEAETRPTEATPTPAGKSIPTMSAAMAATAAPQPSQPSQPSASTSDQQPPHQEKAKALPRVTSVVPAMFVPLDADADLTQPFDAPRSRTERAQAMLDTLDYYQNGVRQGFVYLADLDRRRIIEAAKDREKALEEARAAAKAARTAVGPSGTRPFQLAPPPPPPNDDESLSPDEIDAMIATMRAPAIPGVDYNMVPSLDQPPLPIPFPPADDEVPGGRREAVRQLSEVVEQVLMQMSGYNGHMSQLRGRWRDILEREQKRLDEQFGTLPEGATGPSTTTPAAPQANAQGNAGEGTANATPVATEAQDVAMSGT
ncbi:hypothetical protein SBRCBS47491_003066 [Sporothrix bragantina]|uniref:Uncharacterized protein n=1 Tax=Sporothrix bragantina TaxID=671064 RepID=A0ABP0BC04_9PEZI